MFRFRLEKVLRYRQRREDDEARLLRRAADALRIARERRLAQERFIGDLAREGEARRRGGGDVAQWRLLATFLTVQEERRRVLAAREREAAAAVAKQRERLLAAHRDREVLDRLRERQRLAWEEEQRRRERRFMDEVASRVTRFDLRPDLP
jgi:flagellar FliJ protein